MKHRLALVICMLVIMQSALSRQTFTERLRSKPKASIVIKQDRKIDSLVNGREPAVLEGANKRGASMDKKKSSADTASGPNKSAINASHKINRQANTSAIKRDTVLSRIDSAQQNVSNSLRNARYTTSIGWRVRFFMGGSSRVDKEKALSAGRTFKNLFPDVAVYMHFVSPHWVCAAGDFVNRSEAEELLRRIRESSAYRESGMTIIKSKIKVPLE